MDEKKVVAEIMTKRVICLHEEDNLEIISQGMERYNLRHLPVISDDKLIGLISHRDLLRLAVSSVTAESPDGKLRQQKINEIKTLAETESEGIPFVVAHEPIDC